MQNAAVMDHSRTLLAEIETAIGPLFHHHSAWERVSHDMVQAAVSAYLALSEDDRQYREGFVSRAATQIRSFVTEFRRGKCLGMRFENKKTFGPWKFEETVDEFEASLSELTADERKSAISSYDDLVSVDVVSANPWEWWVSRFVWPNHETIDSVALDYLTNELGIVNCTFESALLEGYVAGLVVSLHSYRHLVFESTSQQMVMGPLLPPDKEEVGMPSIKTLGGLLAFFGTKAIAHVVGILIGATLTFCVARWLTESSMAGWAAVGLFLVSSQIAMAIKAAAPGDEHGKRKAVTDLIFDLMNLRAQIAGSTPVDVCRRSAERLESKNIHFSWSFYELLERRAERRAAQTRTAKNSLTSDPQRGEEFVPHAKRARRPRR